MLTIHDNGLGMNIEAVDQTKNFGLLGMRERVQALEGTFKLSVRSARKLCMRSNQASGTSIFIQIPVNN